jgi:outer membrane murein-binding lipoprotein Lpp
MRGIVIIGALLLGSGCSQFSSYDPEAEDEAISGEVDALAAKVIELEREIGALQSERVTESQGERVSGAILLGSTASGEPLQREFTSMAACERARVALLEEGQRACRGRDVSDSTPGIIYGTCPKPQASCSSL